MKKLFFLTLACGGAMLLNGAELKLQSAAAWRIRSSEFARRYAASSLPVLTIVTEQGGRG